MSTEKVAITLEKALLHELDALVEKRVFSNRSKAIQEALEDKLTRMRRTRLATECAKLDPNVERAIAEENLDVDVWPPY
jgi:metal-responsive CopG/Arc/MetJ family transcriptional regulator